jgi:hypothetical protein
MPEGAMPRLGMVKVGQKAISKNGKEYPQSTDYFIPEGKYQDVFRDKLGDKPNLLPVVFTTDNDEVSCEERWEYRDNAGRLIASGDGDTFKVWDGNDYAILTKEQFPNIMQSVEKRYPSKSGWAVTLTLRFIIPMVPIFGHWWLTTKGNKSSIPQIIGAYDAIKQHRGTVIGTLFDLSVAFAKSQKPGEQSRYPVITLAANADPKRVEAVTKQFITNQKLLSQ